MRKHLLGVDRGSSDTGASHQMDETSAESTGGADDQDIAFAQGMFPHHQQAIGMLEKWGAPTEPSTSGMPDTEHGGTSGEGMMTDEQMRQLEAATGAEFDRVWVRMMIEHHQGAVAMAKAATKEMQGVSR